LQQSVKGLSLANTAPVIVDIQTRFTDCAIPGGGTTVASTYSARLLAGETLPPMAKRLFILVR